MPRLRPGNGARQAFYREEDDGPTITLPRRYRTKAVVLHELAHWALGIDSGLPHHGRTFARVLLDAIGEFCGPERAAELAASYRAHGVHVARPPRVAPDGRLHYGWDERLRLGKGRVLAVSSTTEGLTRELVGPLRRLRAWLVGAALLDGRRLGGAAVHQHGVVGAGCRLRALGARSSPRSWPISASRSRSSSRSSITGSASMLAEAIHSVADTGNQGLLFLGGKRSRKTPTEEHPFGYGTERYFWAFIVALVLFTLGSMFAMYEGIQKLIDPHELDSPIWAFSVLGVAIVARGLVTAHRAP